MCRVTSNDKYHSTQLHPCPESTRFDCVNEEGDLPEVTDVHKIQPLSERHHKHDVGSNGNIGTYVHALCVLTYAPQSWTVVGRPGPHSTQVQTKFLNFHRFFYLENICNSTGNWKCSDGSNLLPPETKWNEWVNDILTSYAPLHRHLLPSDHSVSSICKSAREITRNILSSYQDSYRMA